jgi:hypothetical protein
MYHGAFAFQLLCYFLLSHISDLASLTQMKKYSWNWVGRSRPRRQENEADDDDVQKTESHLTSFLADGSDSHCVVFDWSDQDDDEDYKFDVEDDCNIRSYTRRR